MPDCSKSLRSGSAARCAVCDGKFGLVRHYSWRTPLCSKSASIASELAGKVTAIGWAGSKSPSTSCPRPARALYDGPDLTTRQEYLETAQTLLRAAKTMTDLAIAGQLKALADDYQRRAEKASHVDADA